MKCLLLLCMFAASANAISRGDLYPFGRPAGDNQLPSDSEDVSTPEISLNTTVKFFSREYWSIFVS